MQYIKPALTFQQQADQLIARGLEADQQELIEKLQAVNYYRLSGYWYPFKKPGDNDFKPGTTLKKVWRRYTFDRHLRLLVLDAIERVEVSIRTRLIYHHAQEYGPFGYADNNNLPGLKPQRYTVFMDKINRATSQSKEVFVRHFKETYAHESHLPLWMIAEIMTFGMMLTLYEGLAFNIQKKIARNYSIPREVLRSWLVALNTVRNVCAHHGRLRDRVLENKPKIPRAEKYPQWHTPISIPQDRIFGILTILKYFMNVIAPQSCWDQRFEELLKDYDELPIASMGMTENWKDCPIWTQKPNKQ
ncbi:MAG: hypothetical protein DRP56_10520 [Planctomycetota bacterium]|nr:MAG: hypothetical protein DRP56_10520 [Planctomycetota bacterium]